MKKHLHNSKGLLNLSKAILIAMLLGFGLKANAQCVSSFTVTDSAGYAVINDLSSGSPLYFWDFGDGSSSTTAGDQLHYYGTGTYTICLMVGDSSSGCFDVSCQSITIGCSSYFSSATSNDTTYFSSAVIGSGVSYAWTFGDGGVSTLSSPYHVYPAYGTYYVCLTISTSTGCSDTFCDSVVVDSTGGPSGGCSAYFISSDSSTFAYFYNASTMGAFSTWDFGDGTSGTSTGDITHTYSTTGTYWVCLTISTFAGCTDTYCDSVVIGGSSGGSCYAAYTSVGTTDTVTFYDFSSGSGSLTYSWNFGDGASSTVAGDVVHVYTSPGTYVACLTITDASSSCTDTYCYTINIGSTGGTCDATFTLVQDSTNIYNYFCYMNSTPSSGSYASYYWDFGDGSSSTLQYPSHTYAGSGPYFLCLTVSDTTAFGIACTDTYCDSLTAGMAMSAPMTLNVLPSGSTGVEETTIISSLESYPNPMSDNATINYTITKDADVELVIMDLVGNKIAALERSSKTAGTYTTNWNAEGVAQGMYLMQLRVNNNISTKKLIITR